MRQSLHQKPVTGVNYTADKTNSFGGYYSDGFFDRRMIVDGIEAGAKSTTVASGTKDVAYMGRLFFNANTGSGHYNASLFFPFAGHRNSPESGKLRHTGNMTGYWTSTVYDAGSAMFMRFMNADLTTALWGDAKSMGFSIRCVKEP